MGMGFSFIEKKDFKRFLILGLDNSGKKKIMYRLTFNKDIPTGPEKGFFTETFERKFKYNKSSSSSSSNNVEYSYGKNDFGGGNGGSNESITSCITLFVVCGQQMIRPLWPNYYTDESNGLIFVVDSNDKERIEEVKLEIKKLDENIKIFKNHPFLIFANKQDLKNSLSIEQLIDKLELDQLSSNRKWHIQSSNAITGDGLENGLNWLFSSSHNFT
ncbi:hypothetical protein ACTFIZ_009376 [Dictyostelium cf. discoideum]